MPLEIDVTRLPPQLARVLAAGAPPAARMMAASGVVPGARPSDVVTLVALLTEATEDAVRTKAFETLAKLPAPILNGALAIDLDPGVVQILADTYGRNTDVVARLLRMPRIGESALVLLAERADEAIGELVATNEERLVQFPVVIEKLYMNKRVRMSTADRVLELAVRSGIELSIPAFKEAAAAIKNELIAEATPEPTFEDRLAEEVEQIGAALAADPTVEDSHVIDELGEEKIDEKVMPLHARIAEMTISQKIRMAMLGPSAARLLLVRDTNRLVAAAAIQSPMLNENEVARISTSRQVSEDVLRIIAQDRTWTRSYQVKMNLVLNPRTPFTFSSRLIPHIRESDLRSLSRSKNVPASIQTAARQQLARKKK